MEQLSRRRDEWDMLMMAVGPAVGIAWARYSGGPMLLYGVLGGMAGGAGITIRHNLRSDTNEVIAPGPRRLVTWTLVPMLLVAVGALVGVAGLLALIVVVGAASDERGGGVSAVHFLIPLSIFALAYAMIYGGFRWARGGTKKKAARAGKPTAKRKKRRSKRARRSESD